MQRLFKLVFYSTGAVGFLLISSGVSLSVPFCIGYVIDIINSAAKEGQVKKKLNTICAILAVVFLIGGAANFGRVYLMQISGMVSFFTGLDN